MALTQRNHNPFAHQADFLYMLLDVTTVEGTKVVKIGTMRRVQLLGQLLALEGKKVVAPPIEARGFSKLSRDQVNYLYWNLTQKDPRELDYGELILEIKSIVEVMPPADEHVPTLEYLVGQTKPVVLDETGAVVAKDDTPQRPKATTTTGIIWAICDEVLDELFKGEAPADAEGWKPLRAEGWKRCDSEGFNSGTFGVQYGKWKTAKIASVQKAS